MSAIALGATLYVPVLRSNLLDVVSGSNPDLRSIVVCLEDSLRDDQVEEGRNSFVQFLSRMETLGNRITVYVRPRDIQMLHWMLALPNINAIDGFVLPKVETSNISQWLAPMTAHDHKFMPTIEGAEAFDRVALEQLCRQLMPFQERVTAIRIGGNDILNVLGVRRSKNRSAYDGPLGNVIRDMAATFIPAGFAVAAPVFEHYSSLELLREEVEQDLEHGLLTKTAIHPSQIPIIHDCYRPSADEVQEARSILDKDARAVFASAGSMCEPATHRRWAGNVIARLQQFALSDDEDDNLATIMVA
ncbi:HpcH/HpaI aldolase/citrate lyase family protein [Novosphingobium profundi]|uniref:HpcH/HpaI aldolase/citrate lyase family protein n=1 Tax=Novosphingobium profundi TaxID=1774954 RepID=UPI001BD95D54|nr:HpcH/HpaI aldolase/citrate lyase family protein [Novosphingobium profundi]